MENLEDQNPSSKISTIEQQFLEAKGISAIFEILRSAVKNSLNQERRGLMLGLVDLGDGNQAWFGGYHNIASNAIILNSRPLNFIKHNHPKLHRPYILVVLTHEYIHTLGYINEGETRYLTLKVMKDHFSDPIIIKMAQDINHFVPKFQNAAYGWLPSLDHRVHYVKDFDESSASYFL